MNSTLLITATGAATTGAGLVVAAAAPTDWQGIAMAIGALGTLIVSVGTVVTSVMQAKQKKDIEETKSEIKETKELAAKSLVAVNGGMTKLLEAKTAEAAATATLEAEAAQRERQGIEDAATLKEKERAAAAAQPAPASHTSGEAVPVEVVNPPNKALNVKTDKPT